MRAATLDYPPRCLSGRLTGGTLSAGEIENGDVHVVFVITSTLTTCTSAGCHSPR